MVVEPPQRTPAPPRPPREPAPARHRARALLGNVALALASVGIFFGMLEALLALAGVESTARNTDPFVGFVSNAPLFEEEIGPDGRRFLVTAENKLRFFNAQRFPRHKAPGTYRIFCLGGSTTYGRPYTDPVSFCGWLRELLPVADPRHRWEVINAGGISYASYRVARLMEELALYEPDLFVVYSGHNEFLEERTYRSLRRVPAWIRSTATALAHTRTWAATSSLVTRLGVVGDPTREGVPRLPAEVTALLDRSVGPERYQRDDVLRRRVLAHYRVSLERMVELGRARGAQVVFITPASNLKDCSPFKSQHSDGLDDAGRARVATLLEQARGRIGEARWSEALGLVDRAIALDPRFAELHYRRGKILLELGRSEQAREALERARDEDVCPLRALSPMRNVVLEVAKQRGVPVVDFEQRIEERLLAEQGHRIPGREYFLDHVHLTVEGNRAIALALIETLIAEGVVQPAETWGEAAIASVAERVERGLDRKAHANALLNLARVLVWAGKVDDASSLAERALADAPELATPNADLFATIAERNGDAAARRHYLRRALNANPANPQIHLQMGLAYLDTSRPGWSLERAAAHLLLASAFMPENDMAHQVFGLVMAERQRYSVAYASLAEALRLNPANHEAERALVRLRQLLGPQARPLAREVTLTRYASGAPRQIAQRKPDAGGRNVRDGISVDWYESGEPERFLDYEDGVPHGSELRWDRAGRIVAGARYHHGTQTAEPLEPARGLRPD